MSEVAIVDYDPMWPLLFEQEKARLVPLIGEYVTELEHVGSTSVPGLAAKPIIDIMGIICSNALIEQYVEPLARLSYGYLGENGIPGRYFFRKPNQEGFVERTHHLHIVERDHEQRTFHLLFRNYLRTHPEVAREYEQLKRALAVQYKDDRFGYTDAKAPFIRSVIRAAEQEARAEEQSKKAGIELAD